MSAQARPPEAERLRLLGIMGVEVHVPRGSPLARAVDVLPVRAPSTRRASKAPSMAAARVRIGGVGASADLPLLAAVLRGARLRREDWMIADESTGALPEWRFGPLASHTAAPPAVALPSLAELRNSVAARRDAWRLLRAWLRSA